MLALRAQLFEPLGLRQFAHCDVFGSVLARRLGGFDLISQEVDRLLEGGLFCMNGSTFSGSMVSSRLIAPNWASRRLSLPVADFTCPSRRRWAGLTTFWVSGISSVE